MKAFSENSDFHRLNIHPANADKEMSIKTIYERGREKKKEKKKKDVLLRL